MRYPKSRKIGDWIFFAPAEPVPDILGGNPMTLYPIVRTPKFAIVLRHIFTANVEPDLNTHGFPYLTFILKGGYVEQRDHGEIRIRRRFSFNWIPQHVAHRIPKLFGDTWTIALHMKWLDNGYPCMMRCGDREIPVLDYYLERRTREVQP